MTGNSFAQSSFKNIPPFIINIKCWERERVFSGDFLVTFTSAWSEKRRPGAHYLKINVLRDGDLEKRLKCTLYITLNLARLGQLGKRKWHVAGLKYFSALLKFIAVLISVVYLFYFYSGTRKKIRTRFYFYLLYGYSKLKKDCIF